MSKLQGRRVGGGEATVERYGGHLRVGAVAVDHSKQLGDLTA
jgi:hypothetical protein